MDNKEASNVASPSDVVEKGQPWPRGPNPWFKFYAGDILKGTMDMTAEEFGAYVLLLTHYWQHGALPDTEEDFRRVTRASVKNWRKQSKKILARLKSSLSAENDAGIIAQREAAIALSGVRAKAGRKGGSRPRLVA
jgi:uncharacterized protein YdaU (DUF1376 family)